MWVDNSLVQMRSRLRGTIMITNNRNNNIWLSEIHHIICASDQISRVALLHLARRSPPSNAKLTRALSEWALLLWNREKIYGFCFTESLTARLLRWKIRKGMQTLVGPVGERYRDKESAEELTVSGSYMKNCDPLVFLPRLAMDNRKGFSCFSVNSSSEMWKCY